MRDGLYRPISLIAVKELTPVGKPISIGLKYVLVGMPGKGSRKHSLDNLIEAWRQVYNRKVLLAAGGDSAGCGKWRMTKLIMG
jgi:hypothetical protein